jgi:hypothetical protein
VPYLIVPNYYENGKPWAWIGVAHEVGHHVYRQLKSLRDEIEILIADTVVKNRASDAQQRLWFNYSEEVFADMFGILTMAGAFVAAQQIILLHAGSATPLEGPPDLGRYLEDILVGQDVTHAIPLVRGLIAVHIYKRLLGDHGSPFLADLERWNEFLISKFASKPLRDPHTPRNINLEDKLNLTGELDLDETREVMDLVVNSLLDKRLASLRGRKLSGLVSFIADEQLREDSKKALDEKKKLPSNTTKRHEVAAERLRERQKWRDHPPQ